MKKINLADGVNQHILNIITTTGFDYDDVYANLGENVGKIYYISKYPNEGLTYGWLSDLCNLEGTSTTIEYRFTDPANLVQVFNKKIGELEGDKNLAKTESEVQIYAAGIKDLKEMIRRISVLNEPVGYMNILFHVQAFNQVALHDRIKRVSSIIAISGCNIRNHKYRQCQALQCISPYGLPNKEVSCKGDRNIPFLTFTGGYPMANNGIYDKDGFYLAKTQNGKLVIINMWLRNNDRVNSNWFITGVPGLGKSTFLKDIFIKDLAFGTKYIVLDPENEYRELANNPDINGDIIDCAGGVTGRINPLQIRKSPKINQKELEEGENFTEFYEYDDDENNEFSDMALHIQWLRTFFELYFGSAYDLSVKTILEECLIETYNKFGIYFETDITNFKAEQYPIMSDLYEVILSKSLLKDLTEYRKTNYEKLKDMMLSISKGADQYIWNGYTTTKLKSRFTVMNTSMLLELDRNVKNAQLFNIISWCWNEMSLDRTERIMLGVDEGYLYVDPDQTEILKYLRNISKRARKYEAGLMFITHSVVDVLDPAVKRLGQAIIDNACYKFLMGCDGKNLEETIKLFNLTEREINCLAAKIRGQGILFAGSVRQQITVDVKEELLKMMGKAGGR